MKSVIAAIIIATASTASAESYFYNNTGGYQGKMNNSGHVYGSNGTYQGRVVTTPSYSITPSWAPTETLKAVPSYGWQ